MNRGSNIKRRHSLIQRSDSMSMEWIESCKESLNAPEKMAILPKEVTDVDTSAHNLNPQTDENNYSENLNEKENEVPNNKLLERPNENEYTPIETFSVEELAQNKHKTGGGGHKTSDGGEKSSKSFERGNGTGLDTATCLATEGNAITVTNGNNDKETISRTSRCKKTHQTEEATTLNAGISTKVPSKRREEESAADNDETNGSKPSSKHKAKKKRKREDVDNEEVDKDTKKVKITKKAAEKGKKYSYGYLVYYFY